MKDAKGHGSDPHSIGAMHGIPTLHLRSKSGGPYKVRSLALERAGSPWAIAKSYGNKAVAERVAQHMRTDGGFMRVRFSSK